MNNLSLKEQVKIFLNKKDDNVFKKCNCGSTRDIKIKRKNPFGGYDYRLKCLSCNEIKILLFSKNEL